MLTDLTLVSKNLQRFSPRNFESYLFKFIVTRYRFIFFINSYFIAFTFNNNFFSKPGWIFVRIIFKNESMLGNNTRC